MKLTISLLIFILGMFMTIKGGNLFIDSSIWLADQTGISAGIIGGTIVSVATTLPEFFVSTVASMEGFSEMAVGNVLGSYICNIALIIGVCSLIKPIEIKDKFFEIKGIIMIVYLCIFYIIAINGTVTLNEGYLLMGLIIFFIIISILEYRMENKALINTARKAIELQSMLVNAIKFTLGGILMVYGAHLLVDSGVELARIFGISKQVISLTLLAIGTSIPELATGLTATFKDQQGISIGNILGSNIMNISIVMGGVTLASRGGLIISSQTLRLDLPMAFIIALIFIVAGTCKERIGRLTGALLIVTYIIYISILF